MARNNYAIHKPTRHPQPQPNLYQCPSAQTETTSPTNYAPSPSLLAGASRAMVALTTPAAIGAGHAGLAGMRAARRTWWSSSNEASRGIRCLRSRPSCRFGSRTAGEVGTCLPTCGKTAAWTALRRQRRGCGNSEVIPTNIVQPIAYNTHGYHTAPPLTSMSPSKVSW